MLDHNGERKPSHCQLHKGQEEWLQESYFPYPLITLSSEMQNLQDMCKSDGKVWSSGWDIYMQQTVTRRPRLAATCSRKLISHIQLLKDTLIIFYKKTFSDKYPQVAQLGKWYWKEENSSISTQYLSGRS